MPLQLNEKCCGSAWNIAGSISILLVSFHIARKVLPWLFSNVLAPKLLGPKVDFKRLGDWAVITGATDGIGKAYAKALAKKGISIVLISRSPSKLEDVAKEISSATQVQVKTIAIDFTEDEQIYEKIKTQIEGLDIGVLVNNVGISYQHPQYFLMYTDDHPTFLKDIVAANVHSVTHMTKMILPSMVAKKKGVIINVASLSSVIANPLLCTYSATKAFVDKFSVDLQSEYKHDGIIVQSVRPGFVATNMSKIRKTSLLIPSADCYVNSALKTVGISSQTTGYWPHNVMQFGISAIGYLLGDDYARNMIYKQLSATRKKALRNQKAN